MIAALNALRLTAATLLIVLGFVVVGPLMLVYGIVRATTYVLGLLIYDALEWLRYAVWSLHPHCTQCNGVHCEHQMEG